MITSGEIKKGHTIELDDALYQVLECQHIKMKRTALVKLRLRDIRGGHTIERTFQNTEKFNQARLDYRDMQYLYHEGNLYYFMDNENYEQISLDRDHLGDAIGYLKENESLQVSSYKDEIIGVEIPITVNLEVVETDPGFKGDTATGGSKPAKLETGITIQVPLFINNGDTIKVDTRSGSYLERVN